MAGAEQRTHGSDSPPFKLPSFVSNLFPFLKPQPPPAAVNHAGGPKPTGGVSGDKDAQNSTVSFPYNPPKNPEPLKFEAEASSGRTSNSVILWQVYALGGFLVLKWGWARWNERNQRGIKKDDDDQAPHREDDDDDDQAPHREVDDDGQAPHREDDDEDDDDGHED